MLTNYYYQTTNLLATIIHHDPLLWNFIAPVHRSLNWTLSITHYTVVSIGRHPLSPTNHNHFINQYQLSTTHRKLHYWQAVTDQSPFQEIICISQHQQIPLLNCSMFMNHWQSRSFIIVIFSHSQPSSRCVMSNCVNMSRFKWLRYHDGREQPSWSIDR